MMRRRSQHWVALLVVTAIALYLCWLIIEPFVQVLLWALVLAIVANPLYLWLRRRGQGPNLAALLTTLLVILAVVIPLSLLALAMVRQAVGAAEGLQRFATTALDPGSDVHRFVDQYIDLDQLRDREYLASRMRQFTGAIAGRTLGLVGGILGALLHTLFVLFTLFFFLRDSDQIVPALREWMPLERHEADAVIERTHEVISASVYGILVIAAVQGTLGGFAFWLVRLPSPLLWGVAMFLMSMVPLVGCAIIWAPAALWLLITGAWGKGLFLILWGTLVIGLVDNFLRPRIVGGRARLHELVVFFAVLGGLQVFGILGLVVGPVVVAITLSLLDVVRRAHRPASAALQAPGEPQSAPAPAPAPAAPVQVEVAVLEPPEQPVTAPTDGDEK